MRAVCALEFVIDREVECVLDDREAAHVARASSGRFREFMSGRACARAALTTVGLEPTALPPGRSGAPEWPREVVGSITHCDRFRGAVVAPASAYAGIGLDATPHVPFSDSLAAAVAAPHDLSFGSSAPGIYSFAVRFAIKEAAFKAVSSATGHGIRFDPRRINVLADDSRRRFVVRSAGPSPVWSRVHGSWTVRSGLVLALAWIPRWRDSSPRAEGA
ncbi:MAG: npt [Microbacteriaceae bacterium]|jgi:4'-phosphopantetheinyl transferase EntD|nr:npt [Microbacteriaceae bacterium]